MRLPSLHRLTLTEPDPIGATRTTHADNFRYMTEHRLTLADPDPIGVKRLAPGDVEIDVEIEVVDSPADAGPTRDQRDTAMETDADAAAFATLVQENSVELRFPLRLDKPEAYIESLCVALIAVRTNAVEFKIRLSSPAPLAGGVDRSLAAAVVRERPLYLFMRWLAADVPQIVFRLSTQPLPASAAADMFTGKALSDLKGANVDEQGAATDPTYDRGYLPGTFFTVIESMTDETLRSVATAFEAALQGGTAERPYEIGVARPAGVSSFVHIRRRTRDLLPEVIDPAVSPDHTPDVFYDEWTRRSLRLLGGRSPQEHPEFAHVFNQFAVDVAQRLRWRLEKGERYPYQRIAELLFHPRIAPNVRVGVYTATGSGKTRVLARALDNFIEDLRLKVVIFNQYAQLYNFVRELGGNSQYARRYLEHDAGVKAELANYERLYGAKDAAAKYFSDETASELNGDATKPTTLGKLRCIAFRKWLSKCSVRLDIFTRALGATGATVVREGGLRNRVIIVDEAHQIFVRDATTTNSKGAENLENLRAAILEATGSAVLLATATPHVDLMSIFKDESGNSLPSNSYAVVFNDLCAPIFPRVVQADYPFNKDPTPKLRLDPLAHLSIRLVPMEGTAIVRYMVTALAWARKVKETPDTKTRKKMQRALQIHQCNNTELPGGKASAIRAHLKNLPYPCKVVIMSNVLSPAKIVALAAAVGTPPGWNECIAKDNTSLDELETFGKAKPDDGNVAFVNGQIFGEGVDMPNTSVLILLEPPSRWGTYTQFVGRVLRGYRNAGDVHARIMIFASVHPFYSTADEDALISMVREREISEPDRLQMMQGGVCAQLIASLMHTSTSGAVSPLKLDCRIAHDKERKDFYKMDMGNGNVLDTWPQLLLLIKPGEAGAPLNEEGLTLIVRESDTIFRFYEKYGLLAKHVVDRLGSPIYILAFGLALYSQMLNRSNEASMSVGAYPSAFF